MVRRRSKILLPSRLTSARSLALMKLAQLPRRTASRLPRAAASLARRALSTQPASDDVEESVHDMLRQTCRDFVEAQVKPVAGELDQTHRRAQSRSWPAARALRGARRPRASCAASVAGIRRSSSLRWPISV